MSNRYRAYGQADDPPLEEGDRTLVGVNLYDAPENLQPGLAQEAINIDFTSGDAVTRGGVTCVPELGSAPFQAGANWETKTGYADRNWRAVTYGAGPNRFVAVSSELSAPNAMYSTDGETWLTSGISLNDWAAVAFGAGLYVAVSGSGSISTSPDGVTWTAQTAPGPVPRDWAGITWSETAALFVAVAKDGGGDAVMTSADGITWELQTTPPSALNAWRSVAYGNGTFVAVATNGTGNRVMTSPTGVTWTARSSAADYAWRSVTFGNGTFVAVASDGGASSCMTSTDGITWTLRTTVSGSWYSVAYGNGLFAAVSNAAGSVTNMVMTSPNGITWTAADASAVAVWQGVTHANNTFVAVGDATSTSNVMTRGSLSGFTSVWASGIYSDQNTPTDNYVVLVGQTKAGFYAFGKTSFTIDYPSGTNITQQSTVVQAGNYLFIFPGEGQTPLQWDGDRSGDFIAVPDTVLPSGFESVPESNQATYYQNRLWVVNGKDRVAASDVLAFSDYDVIANDFNLNTGSADYVVATYPFGDNALVVFKHNSIILLENVQGSLNDVTATEVTRNLGLIGINAVTAVGPDLVYFSDRNISTIRLNLQNKLQGVSEPLSRNIDPILKRVNWTYGYKISMGYWNNLLYVAVPLDNSTVCNTILVYNFVTNQWYGEWNFASTINLAVQGFVVADYLGQNRIQIVTEDGKIFVMGNGQNDISGTIVAEISTSLTTRAYALGDNMQAPRRVGLDLSTNRPNFSITSYSDGASESSEEVTDQTYSREDSWLWNDSTYAMNNSNDDYNRAFRKDYSTGPDSVQPGTGFLPEMPQDYRFTVLTRRRGRLSWFKLTNTTGFLRLNGVSFEGRQGSRSNLTQVG